jgi:hypothetical protein
MLEEESKSEDSRNMHLPGCSQRVERNYGAPVVVDGCGETSEENVTISRYPTTHTVSQRFWLPSDLFDHVMIISALFNKGNIADDGLKGEGLLLLLQVSNGEHFVTAFDLGPLPIFKDDGCARDIHESCCITDKKIKKYKPCEGWRRNLAM